MSKIYFLVTTTILFFAACSPTTPKQAPTAQPTSGASNLTAQDCAREQKALGSYGCVSCDYGFNSYTGSCNTNPNTNTSNSNTTAATIPSGTNEGCFSYNATGMTNQIIRVQYTLGTLTGYSTSGSNNSLTVSMNVAQSANTSYTNTNFQAFNNEVFSPTSNSTNTRLEFKSPSREVYFIATSSEKAVMINGSTQTVQSCSNWGITSTNSQVYGNNSQTFQSCGGKTPYTTQCIQDNNAWIYKVQCVMNGEFYTYERVPCSPNGGAITTYSTTTVSSGSSFDPNMIINGISALQTLVFGNKTANSVSCPEQYYGYQNYNGANACFPVRQTTNYVNGQQVTEFVRTSTTPVNSACCSR